MRVAWAALVLAVAGVPALGAEPVELIPGAEELPLAGHIEYLRDADPVWTLDDVRSPEIAGRFVVGDSVFFNVGYTHLATWRRLVLHAPAGLKPADANWVLVLGMALMDEVDVYLTHQDGTTESFVSGDKRHTPDGQLAHHLFAFPLHIASGEAATLHIRMANGAMTLGGTALWPQRAFVDWAGAENFLWGAFYGVMLVMIVYNLLVYLWNRDSAYLFYVLFVASLAGMLLAFDGYVRQYGNDWFEAAPRVLNWSFAFFRGLSNLFLLLFARAYLSVRSHALQLDRLLLAIAAANVLLIVAMPFVPYGLVIRLGDYVSLAGILAASGVSLALLKGDARAAKFFLVAFGLYMAASALSVASFMFSAQNVLVLRLFQPIALCLGVALFSLALADRISMERRERERLARLKNFFAPQVAEAILDEGIGLLAPKRREVTVVFTDLRGFTGFAAQSEPEEVIRVLREYHEAVVETTARHGGNVEHIAGDGVMIYFNAPVEVSEPEVRAVRLAFELRGHFESLCQVWRGRGHELGVGIGVAGGYATVGAVGAKGRMDYSCIGTVTNLASRLCAQAQHGQVLSSQQFVNKLDGRVKAERLGEHEMKGMPKPVSICNLQELA